MEAPMTIRHPIAIAFAAAAALALAAPAFAAEDHVLLEADAIAYAPGPASLPEGAEFAVLYGDPGAEGLFALRVKFPAGYQIPPHTHPKPEVVTIISGTFNLGMGEEADPDAATALPAGSFFALEPGMAHYAHAEGETIVQINSTGPWGIDYIDPADDPRTN